jgi:hypothetical protein
MHLNLQFANVISKLPDKVAPLTVVKSSFKSSSFKSDSYKGDSFSGDSYRLDRLEECSPTVKAGEYAAVQARHNKVLDELQSQLATMSAENKALQQDELELQQSVIQLTAKLNASEQKHSELVLNNSMLKEEHSAMHAMQQQFGTELKQQTVATLTSAASRHVELERQIAALQAAAAVREAVLLKQTNNLVAATVRESELLSQIDELVAAAAARVDDPAASTGATVSKHTLLYVCIRYEVASGLCM